MKRCRDYLTEDDWPEGFTCSLPELHDGPHRAEGGIDDVNESRATTGQRYSWVMEWAYLPLGSHRRGPQGAPYERD